VQISWAGLSYRRGGFAVPCASPRSELRDVVSDEEFLKARWTDFVICPVESPATICKKRQAYSNGRGGRSLPGTAGRFQQPERAPDCELNAPREQTEIENFPGGLITHDESQLLICVRQPTEFWMRTGRCGNPGRLKPTESLFRHGRGRVICQMSLRRAITDFGPPSKWTPN
jgi:hypothetical protein